MTRLKSDEILSEWLAVADRARQPHQAPKPTTTRIRLPIGMAALAAVVVIVAVVGSRVVAPPVGPGGSASASPSATATVAQPSATPTPGASPSPASTPVTFTTAGVASNWQGFTWGPPPADSPFATYDFGTRVLAWRGGYAAYTTTTGAANNFVWTSADGLTWRRMTDIVAPRILVAVSPTGLVAFADDPSAVSPTATVWTSTDGVAWHNAGSPTGLAFIDSIAGTSAGLVATSHTLAGTGKFATSQFGVAFSTDGLNWTPVSVQPGLTWSPDSGPQVQSGANRFFVFGALASPPKVYAGGLWWSDDGRTWTRSSNEAYTSGLDFGEGGIVMHTTLGLVPGGTGLELSTDGGKSWRKANDPLGAVVCGPRECSTGPDGVISSNGSFFVAVKSNGQAWISYDGNTWTSIAWGGPPKGYSLLVLPRGVVSDAGQYGAAK